MAHEGRAGGDIVTPLYRVVAFIVGVVMVFATIMGASADVGSNAVAYWELRNLNFTEYFTGWAAVNDTAAVVNGSENYTAGAAGQLSFSTNATFHHAVNGDWTYFGWVKRDSGGQEVVWSTSCDNCSGSSGVENKTSVEVRSGGEIRARCRRGGSSTFLTSPAGVTPTGEYFHLGVFYDDSASNLSFYVNDTLVYNTTVASLCNLDNNRASNLTFGKLLDTFSSTDAMNGGLGPQLFYNALKPRADLTTHYNNGSYYDVRPLLGNEAPGLAVNESPANNTVTRNPVVLSWNASDPDGDSLSYDVYFGNTSSPSLVSGDQSANTYDPSDAPGGCGGELCVGETYYWRVDTKDGVNTTTGVLWNFTVENTPPPAPVPDYPLSTAGLSPLLNWSQPADSDAGGSQDLLRWDVYLGTNTSPSLVASNLSSTEYQTGLLVNDTTYYWRVVARDDSESTNTSSLVNFTTVNQAPSPATVGGDVSNGSEGVWPNREGGGVYAPTSMQISCSDPDSQDELEVDVWWNPDGEGYEQLYDDESCSGFNKNPTMRGHTNYSVYVVVNDSAGAAVTGPETWFTTRNLLPYFQNEAPPNGTTNVSNDQVLSWDGVDPENDTLSYDVYFGLSSSPPLVSSGQSASNYSPSLVQNKTYYWRVTASDGQNGSFWRSSGAASPEENDTGVLLFVTRANFAPSAPENESPSSGSVNESLTPTLSWDAADPDNDSLSFDVYFGNSSSPPLVSENQSGNSYSPGLLAGHTTYYWRVVADDNFTGVTSSEEWNFTTQNQNPPAPTLVAPLGAGAAINPVLNWSGVVDPDGDAVEYDVRLGTNTTPGLVGENLSLTSLQVYNLSGETMYYWRVTARDGFGGSNESVLGNFTTINRAPFAPVNESPANASTTSNRTPILSWNASDWEGDTLNYSVRFGTNTTPAVVATGLTSNSYNPGLLDPHTTYYWRVNATDGGGWNESDLWRFTTPNEAPVITSALPNGTPFGSDYNVSAYGAVLSWTASDADNDTIYYDVYLGDSAESGGFSVAVASLNQTNNTFTPGRRGWELQPGREYWWQLTARDLYGGSDSITGVDTLAFDVLTESLENVSSTNINASDSGFLLDDREGLAWCAATGQAVFEWSLHRNGSLYDSGHTQRDPESWTLVDHGSASSVAAAERYGLGLGLLLSNSSGLYYELCNPDGTGCSSAARLDDEAMIGYFRMLRGANTDEWLVAYQLVNESVVRLQLCNGDASSCVNVTGPEADEYAVAHGLRNAGSAGQTEDGIRLYTVKDGQLNVTYYDSQLVRVSDGFISNDVDAVAAHRRSYAYSDNGVVTTGGLESSSFGTSVSELSIGELFDEDKLVTAYVDGGAGYVRYDGSSSSFSPAASNVSVHVYTTGHYGLSYYNGSRLLYRSCRGLNCSAEQALGDSSSRVFFDEFEPSSHAVSLAYLNGSAVTRVSESLYYTESAVVARIPKDDLWIGDNWSVTCAADNPSVDSPWSASSYNSTGTSVTSANFTVQDGANQPPNPPTGEDPANGSAGVVVDTNLSWTATDNDGDNLTFTVYLGTNETPEVADTGLNDSLYDPNLTGHKTYYWLVEASDGNLSTNSSLWTFETRNRPVVFTNRSPGNDSVNVTLSVVLNWSIEELDGDNVSYDVYFGESSSPPLVSSGQNESSYDPGGLDPQTVYYWRVVGDDEYNTTDTPVFTFETLNTPPNTPSNESPSSGNASVPRVVTLSWVGGDNDSEPVEYDVYWGTNQSPGLQASVSSPSYVPPNSYSTTYYWRVTAKDAVSNTTGPLWNYTTVANTPPNTPSGEDPANGSAGVPFNKVLSWSSSDNDTDSLSYNVAFGTNTSPDTVATGLVSASYAPSTNPNTTYYWRVTANDSYGGVASGPLWEYTVRTNQSPSVPVAVDPLNNTGGYRPSQTVEWNSSDPENDTLSFDVYFGNTSSPPLVSSSQSGTTYDPGGLANNETYYWIVNASDGWGNVVSSGLLVFGVRSNELPAVPSNPFPSNGSVDQARRLVLQWDSSDPDLDTLQYDLYVDGLLVADDLSSDSYSFEGSYLTSYDWRVVVNDTYGGVVSGPEWFFTTAANQAPGGVSDESIPPGSEDAPRNNPFSWTQDDPNNDELTWDFLFGTSPSPPVVASGLSSPLYDPGTLSPGTTYYWGVNGSDGLLSNASVIYNFTTAENTLPNVSLAEPLAGEENVSLDDDLNWSGGDEDNDTVEYDVYFGNTTGPPLVSEGQNTTSYDPGTLSAGVTYYWRVVADDGFNTTDSGVQNFTTTGENFPPSVSNPSPANGSTDAIVNPLLQWDAFDANGDSLNFDVYFGNTSSPPLVSGAQTANSYDPGVLLNNTQYWWFVNVTDGSETATGGLWTFTTGENNTAPDAPSTPDPADGASINDSTPTLDWTVSDPDPGDDVVSDVYFGTTTTPPLVFSGATSSFYAPGSLGTGQFYWRVVARDRANESTSGPLWTFNVTNQAPIVSSPVPVDGDDEQPVNLNLSWTASDADNDSLTYDVYLGTPTVTLVSDDQTGTSFEATGLDYSAVYQWGVVANDSKTTTSAFWSFTTADNAACSFATASPVDGAVNVPTSKTLSWSVTDYNEDVLEYDVYFGSGVASLVSEGQAGTTYSPSLVAGSTYYWRVVARDPGNETCSLAERSFTTAAGGEGGGGGGGEREEPEPAEEVVEEVIEAPLVTGAVTAPVVPEVELQYDEFFADITLLWEQILEDPLSARVGDFVGKYWLELLLLILIAGVIIWLFRRRRR